MTFTQIAFALYLTLTELTAGWALRQVYLSIYARPQEDRK